MPRDVIPAPGELRWFIFRVVGGRERQVLERLTESLIDCYTPVMQPRRRRPGDRPQPVALMPGYVLARTARNAPTWWDVIETPHVVGALVIAGAYGAMTATELAEIRAMENEHGSIPEVATTRFKRNDWVRVTDGPFSSFDGDVLRTGTRIEEKLDRDGRVVGAARVPYAVVNISMFGARRKVEVLQSWMEMA